jgi:hypothetical protein
LLMRSTAPLRTGPRTENKVDQAVNDTMTKNRYKQFEAACEGAYKDCDCSPGGWTTKIPASGKR